MISATGAAIFGTMNFNRPVSPDEATKTIMLEAARIAFTEQTEFDPFNCLVDVRPIGKLYKQTN